MLPESDHVAMPVLVAGDAFDPMLSWPTLYSALEELMYLVRVGNKVPTLQWNPGYCTLDEIVIVGTFLRCLNLPDDITQG